MPIPSPNRFKDKDSFISACMEVEVGSGKDRDQAFAICNSVWENRLSKMTTQQRVAHKISGIDLSEEQELITPNPCQEGYIAIGLKPKGGRMVPNCVPE